MLARSGRHSKPGHSHHHSKCLCLLPHRHTARSCLKNPPQTVPGHHLRHIGAPIWPHSNLPSVLDGPGASDSSHLIRSTSPSGPYLEKDRPGIAFLMERSGQDLWSHRGPKGGVGSAWRPSVAPRAITDQRTHVGGSFLSSCPPAGLLRTP